MQYTELDARFIQEIMRGLKPAFERPCLIEHTFVAPSNIHGQGVFANKNIRKGLYFASHPAHGVRITMSGGKCFYLANPNCEEVANVPYHAVDTLLRPLDAYQLICGPVPTLPAMTYSIVGLPNRTDHHGHMVNHSATPNAVFSDLGLVALRDIKTSEEILCDYGPNYTWNCKVCGDTTTWRCKGCSKVAYCSQDHQRKDWINHRPVCQNIGVK